ncbi:acyl carrier protein [Paenibacillus woosongensis]|uniref:Acyl carrier protein n=1 Tax=Paenibacillus woosongensis TaxID=307580 RepID=A0AA95IB87_9BACL|nr:acyl carrier protein [Paenibacillus woosongensis]WHX50794.1 acyl carrier protein [Paenibacillus woosongensis]
MVNNNFVELKVQEKLIQILGIDSDQTLHEVNLSLLGLDSMKSVQLIVELEELFDITYNDEELIFDNFSTFQLIVDRVKEKVGNSVTE